MLTSWKDANARSFLIKYSPSQLLLKDNANLPIGTLNWPVFSKAADLFIVVALPCPSGHFHKQQQQQQQQHFAQS